MSDVLGLYERAVGEFDRRVAAIEDGQWHDPTPCTEWDVRDLVNHITAEDLWVPPILSGATLEEVGDRFDGDVLGDDPKAAWADARNAALAAAQDAALDGPVHTSMGPIPAQDYLGQIFGDHLIHAWDLANGIGAETDLDPELVDALLRMVGPHEDMMRASGVFGDRVPTQDGAPPQVQLLAIFGRTA